MFHQEPSCTYALSVPMLYKKHLEKYLLEKPSLKETVSRDFTFLILFDIPGTG
jgi:hypothetical protein